MSASASHPLLCPCLFCQKLGPPAPSMWTMTPPPRPCEHCYCTDAPFHAGATKPHRQCCNCGNRQLVVEKV